MGLQLPVEFENRIKDLIGDEYQDFRVCYDNDNYQSLRFNALKVDSGDYDRIIGVVKASDEQVPWESNGRYYYDDARPGKHPYHEMGLYYIQEPSAMSAAALLAPGPGMRVLDLCAAPGGKSTQLANFLKGQGLLVSNEINNARCKILSSNIERLGIKNALVTNEDSFKLAEKFPAFFHAILVDAPCSGEGMFRKNPEAINEWSPENVLMCAKRQGEILDNAARMLLPGGCIVYSTCTFSREENEEAILRFLEEHSDFSLEERDASWFSKSLIEEDGAYRLWPHRLHGEGHFAAVLRKSGKLDLYQPEEKPQTSGKKKNAPVKGLAKDMTAIFDEFCSETLCKNDIAIKPERLTLFGEQLNLLPEGCPNLNGIHVLRAGLHLGEFKKNRFEPSHALALALKAGQTKLSFDLKLDDPRTYGFFNGEGIMLNSDDIIPANKGWCLVTVDGYSAGWGKIAGMQIKNHYPKGLRRDLR